MRPVDYKQTDPRWKNNDYSAKGESTTIGKAGCGPTCMAMVIAALKDARITPADTADWAKKSGYKAPNQGTYYTYFNHQGEAFDLNVRQLNKANLKESATKKATHTEALAAILAGDWVICCMGPGHWTKAGHYILWWGVEGMNAIINDPATNAPARAKAPITTLQNEVKYYWVVEVPKAPKKDGVSVINVIASSVKTQGFIKNGTSYVPARAVAEAFKLFVAEFHPTNSVTIDGLPIDIINLDGTAYTPARPLGAMLGVMVLWDERTKTVVFKKG